MIEPMWLSKEIEWNSAEGTFPKKIHPSGVDVAIKLNELVEAHNKLEAKHEALEAEYRAHRHATDFGTESTRPFPQSVKESPDDQL